MNIVKVRQISQVFFLILFVWFCVVATLGEQWWQLRGWPVNWFVQLDPLVGLGTLLTTHTLYAGLLWGLATVVLTIILGRFFCSWICPFGSIHHFVGYVGNRKKSPADRAKLNRYRSGQSIKYWLLIFLLATAITPLMKYLLDFPKGEPWIFWVLAVSCVLAIIILSRFKVLSSSKRAAVLLSIGVGIWFILSVFFHSDRTVTTSLQIGLLDPIPLLHRTFNLAILPIIDESILALSAKQRYYDGAWLIGAIFLAAVFLNLVVPRFYCRFICPLGALFGVLSRFSIWRFGKKRVECTDCHLCEAHCEGACEPSGQIRISECILCTNCLHSCHKDLIGYQTLPSVSGEVITPDVSRRQFVTMLFSGVAAVPLLHLNGNVGPNWNPKLIRPPGALSEKEFLSRCIK